MEQPAQAFSPDPGLRGTAFPTTFYPSAQSIGQASAIRLGAGGEVDVSIVLPATNAVTVKGTMNVPGEIGDGQVNLYSTFGEHRLLFMDAWVQPGKTFEFKNVPPARTRSMPAPRRFRRLQLERSRAAASRGGGHGDHAETSTNGLAGRPYLLRGRASRARDSLYVSLHNEKGVVSGTEVSPKERFR